MARDSIIHSYSWLHYAPQQWYDFKKRQAQEIKNLKEGKETGVRCSACGSPEGTTIKHKQCSACKQKFYCSTDCQKQDWSNGHKTECKELQKKAKK